MDRRNQRDIGTFMCNDEVIRDAEIEWILDPNPMKLGHQLGMRLRFDPPLTADEAEKLNTGNLRVDYDRRTTTRVIFDPEFLKLARATEENSSEVELRFPASYDPDAPPRNS